MSEKITYEELVIYLKRIKEQSGVKPPIDTLYAEEVFKFSQWFPKSYIVEVLGGYIVNYHAYVMPRAQRVLADLKELKRLKGVKMNIEKHGEKKPAGFEKPSQEELEEIAILAAEVRRNLCK